jgi:hypothetical protein
VMLPGLPFHMDRVDSSQSPQARLFGILFRQGLEHLVCSRTPSCRLAYGAGERSSPCSLAFRKGS